MKTIYILIILLFANQVNCNALICNKTIMDSISLSKTVKTITANNQNNNTKRKVEGFSVASFCTALYVLALAIIPNKESFFDLKPLITAVSSIYAVILAIIGNIRLTKRKLKNFGFGFLYATFGILISMLIYFSVTTV